MASSAYRRVARLGTHPAFTLRDGRLHCPRGCEAFDRFADYNRHVLAHELSQAEAYRWLDAKTYRKLTAQNNWPEPPPGRPAE